MGLTYMNKADFKRNIDEYRFVVQHVRGNKFEVFTIGASAYDGTPRFSLHRVVNPKTKDGLFNQGGGGYSKAMACIEDIAIYVEENASDKDTFDFNCLKYLQNNQNWNEI